MQKHLRIATGLEPGPSSLHLADGTIITIPRTQMKGVYSRFKTHILVMREPGTLEFRATMTAKVFTLLLFLCGVALIICILVAKLPASFILGGILLLGISVISSMAWMESIFFHIEKQSGILRMQKSSPLKQQPLIICLSDIAAIQVLAVELDSGAYDVMVTTYEINLVFANPAGKRIWLLSYGNHYQAKQATVQLAEFLGRPVLEHTADF